MGEKFPYFSDIFYTEKVGRKIMEISQRFYAIIG
jgi:hypothetical protein